MGEAKNSFICLIKFPLRMNECRYYYDPVIEEKKKRVIFRTLASLYKPINCL